jgi:membrane protein involved in colicin uptake
MEDLIQLYQNNQSKAEEVHFNDADFDQDFRVDPLTTMEAMASRFKEQEKRAKKRLQELKDKEEETIKENQKAEEEKQYKKFKERHLKEQEAALNSQKDEHGTEGQ